MVLINEIAAQLTAELHELYPQAEHIFTGNVSPALGVHTGPGLMDWVSSSSLTKKTQHWKLHPMLRLLFSAVAEPQ